MNTTFLVFVTQFTLSLLSFGLFALWVIYPSLRGRSLRDALTPLLLFETLRTIGLIVIVPSLVDAALPSGFTVPGAVGDMIAVVLAFAALVAVRADWRVAPALVWLFTVEGLADFINATVQGLRFNITSYHLGVGWLLPTYGVPAFVAVHLTVIAVLVTSARRERRRAADAAAKAVTAPDRLMASLS
jgi:hypothetical protein